MTTSEAPPRTQTQDIEPDGAKPRGRRISEWLSPGKIGGVYVLLLLIVIFSVWVPDTFPEGATARQILNSNAVSAIAALTLIIPLSAGVFDLTVPYTMTLSGVLATYAIVNSGLPVWVGILIAMGAAVLVGVGNGIVVVVFKIDSLIGTLATGFLIQSLVVWRTGSRNVSGPELGGTFRDIAQLQWLFDLTLPVYYALAVAFAIWYLMEHTATGRRIYATGFNRDATRLASVRTERLQFGALIASSTLAGFGGIVLASNIGSGSATAGVAYLLPAFAAVFLGATQFKNGRMNAWGTVLAVLLLGTLTTGLGLAKVDQWVQQFATGVVLIAALALTGYQVRKAGTGGRRAGVHHKATPGAGTGDGSQPPTNGPAATSVN